MRLLSVFLSIVLVFAVIFFLGGLMMSSKWMVSRSIVVHASPEQVYLLICNFREWERWSPWSSTKDPTLVYAFSGPISGVGAKQSWTSEKMGRGWMELTSSEPKTGIAYDVYVDMGRTKLALYGNIGFIVGADGTKVTWVSRGELCKSLIRRWGNLIMKDRVGRDLEVGLMRLKAAVEESHEHRLSLNQGAWHERY